MKARRKSDKAEQEAKARQLLIIAMLFVWVNLLIVNHILGAS